MATISMLTSMGQFWGDYSVRIRQGRGALGNAALGAAGTDEQKLKFGGMILAMARAAGEVAPLMIVGMVKLAPDLPLDGYFPFVHLERKFMHLGFHIYDVGFQSPNVEATKPLVFATSFLLIAVVTSMNMVAIWIRNHLRRKYASSAV